MNTVSQDKPLEIEAQDQQQSTPTDRLPFQESEQTSRITYLVDNMPEPRCSLRKRKDHNTLIRDTGYTGVPCQKRRKTNEFGTGIDILPRSALFGSEKRTKERSLEDIVEKVARWRQLYAGVYETGRDGKEVFVEYTLEDSAKLIGISKKSLDDYLLQIRYGRKFGFDFEANKDSKVGVLRSFVNEKRSAFKSKHKIVKL